MVVAEGSVVAMYLRHLPNSWRNVHVRAHASESQGAYARPSRRFRTVYVAREMARLRRGAMDGGDIRPSQTGRDH